MKPRKIQKLYEAISETEDPLSLTILEGLIKLFEWDSKMKEIFPSIDPDIVKCYKAISRRHCSGYLCSFSEDFLIENEKAAKPFEVPEDEAIRDFFSWNMIAICPYVRDLAELYRKKDNVRGLVDKMIEAASSDKKEVRSCKNILSKAWFMSDFQRDRLRNMIIHNHNNS